MRTRSLLLALGSLPLVLPACAAPEVRDTRGHVEEEDGITRLHYDEPALAPFVVDEGEAERLFDLERLVPSTAFDRIGVRWDARTNGGMTQVQVRVAGTDEWLAVHVDDEQHVDDGRTFYAGHVDVPAGAQLESRLRVVRGPGSGVSPLFTSVTIEVFDRALIEEQGEAAGGDGAGAGGDAATSIPDAMPGEYPDSPDDASGGSGTLGGDGAIGSMIVEEPTIVSRETWGARSPRCQGSQHAPYRMTFHHTETPNGERGAAARARMRQMQAYHQNSRGWCDIGYHFVVDADGVIYRGRTTTARAGAHVANQNTGNLGVSLMGSYDSNGPPQSALDGLAATFAFLANTWGIPVDAEHIRGHKQWNGQSTSCPGSPLLGLKTEILDGVRMRLEDEDAEPGPSPTPAPGPSADGEVVVDDASVLFHASPTWFLSAAVPTPYGTSYHARSAETVSDVALWAATLESREYEVFARWPAANNRARSAPFFVYHRYGTETVFVDQTQNGNAWVSLGTFPFDAGTTDRVGLSCWTASGDFVIADAVRLVPR